MRNIIYLNSTSNSHSDHILTQVVSEPTRGCALLDLMFLNREGLVGDEVARGCLGHSE